MAPAELIVVVVTFLKKPNLSSLLSCKKLLFYFSNGNIFFSFSGSLHSIGQSEVRLPTFLTLIKFERSHLVNLICNANLEGNTSHSKLSFGL